jgi:hypothetical protein
VALSGLLLACKSALESGAALHLDRNYEALAEMLAFEPVRLPV